MILLILSILVAAPLIGQQSIKDDAPADADYSRDTLLRLFAENPVEEEDERVRFRTGLVDFRIRGVRFRVGYLPFFMPLQGSMPWIHSHRWPDPFILTGTEIPYTSRTWRDERALSAEVRRIERRLRDSNNRGTEGSATVQVKPD